MGQTRLWGKDFSLVVIGQVISLFGNAILRFALPLHILEQSGSAALFGIVSALSFLPMIIMSPIGGIIADRTNKQQSVSGLLGPIIGGILYGVYGLSPIITVGGVCFISAAVMELFIRIPHTPREKSGSVWGIVRDDMVESLRFVLKEKPVMAKGIGIIFAFNLFMSTMLMIGLPVIITQVQNMSSELYGFSQGALAAGGIVGGIGAGTLGNRLAIRRIYLLLFVSGIAVIPMGLTLLFGAPAFLSYIVITAMSFLIMASATIFNIKMMSFVQANTTASLVGKVIACLIAVSICAQPIGQAFYGVLFEQFAAVPWVVVLGSALASCVIAVYSTAAFNDF